MTKPKNINFGHIKAPLHSNSIFQKRSSDNFGNRVLVDDHRDSPLPGDKNKFNFGGKGTSGFMSSTMGKFSN